jgi:hypothetical protein
MKTTNLFAIGLLVAVVGSSSFASGFRCEGDGYSVKLFNKTSNATRTPSVMIVSHEDASPATLLRRDGAAIRKHNRLNTVQYVVDGNNKIGADTVILQIAFKEGQESLEAGETADGQLILVADDSRQVVALACERYLKGE